LAEITNPGTYAIGEIHNHFEVYLFWILVPLFLYFIHSRYPQWFSGRKMLLWLIAPVILSLSNQAIFRASPDTFSFFWIVVPYLFWIIIPLFLYFAYTRYPQWFSGRKILFWLIGIIILSLGVDIAKYVPYYEQINEPTVMLLLANHSGYLFGVIIPLFLCFAHMQYPQWFSWKKNFLWLIGIAVFAFGYLKAIAFIAGLFESQSIASELARTSFFVGAWLYLCLATLPIILIYCTALFIRKKKTGKIPALSS